MTEVLQAFVDEMIQVVTLDGKVIVGKLRGYDQTTNLILEKCEERVYSESEGVKRIPQGLYLMRGDNIAIVGQLDTTQEQQIDFEKILAAPIKSTIL